MDAFHIDFHFVQVMVDHGQRFHNERNSLMYVEMMNEYFHQNLGKENFLLTSLLVLKDRKNFVENDVFYHI